MIIHKAYKFRLKTNAVLMQQMACVAGCARLVWNKTLAEQKARLDRGEGVQSYSAMCKALTTWKHTHTYAFLDDVPFQVLQQKLKDLRRAFDDFFNLAHPDKGFPQCKKKFKHDSFRFPQDVKVDGNRVFLPKIGWRRFFKSQNVEGVIKNATVSRRSHHWYVSIQVEVTLGTPVHPATSMQGVDRGVKAILDQGWGEFLYQLTYKQHWRGGAVILVSAAYAKGPGTREEGWTDTPICSATRPQT